MSSKKQGKKRTVLLFAGSIALAIGVMAIMPKTIGFLADQVKNDVKPKDDDDWGPEIVHRTR